LLAITMEALMARLEVSDTKIARFVNLERPSLPN
jgi:hypothetical protein